MSEKLSRTEFENRLDEYLRGDLPASARLDCEAYLAEHPAARQEVAELRRILPWAAPAALPTPPADLTAAAARDIRRSLAGRRRFWRPAVAWSLAASLLLAVGLTLWPSGSSLMFADVIARLQTVQSVAVNGWVRGEGGHVVPFRQWLLADGTLRAEVGEGGQARIVVVKGHERLIQDRGGRLYAAGIPAGQRLDLDLVLRGLQAAYQRPDAADNSYEFSKQDLGEVMRFTRRDRASLGYGPSNRKWVIEVDKRTALPVLAQLHQLVDGHWVQISELHYAGFDRPVAAEIFELTGPALPLTAADRQRFWFELFISPDSIRRPAVYVPAGGLQLYWSAADEMPAGVSSGGSTFAAGGISTLEFRNLPLTQVVRDVTGLPAAAGELGKRRVSLVMSAKTVLPWRYKLGAVLDHLGLAYEVVRRDTTRRRYVFSHDGWPIAPSAHRFTSARVVADSAGYHYVFERVELQAVIRSLLGNCDRQGHLGSRDTLDFAWEGSPAENPFRQRLDLVCDIPGATFATNIRYLREDLGVKVRVEEEVHRVREIRLLPGD